MGWNPTLVLVKDRNTDRRTTPGGLSGEIPKKLRFKTRMEKKNNACYSCCCCCYNNFLLLLLLFCVSTAFRKRALGTRLRKTVSVCNGSVNSKSPVMPPASLHDFPLFFNLCKAANAALWGQQISYKQTTPGLWVFKCVCKCPSPSRGKKNTWKKKNCKFVP